MENQNIKNILITGVSSGIGLECAKIFISNKYRVFGSIRNNKDAERLSRIFGDDFFIPLIFDVRDESALKDSADIVRKKLNGSGLDCLVNNAGIAVSGPLMHVPIAEFENQLNVNVLGTMRVTQAFLPFLGACPELSNKPGKIINISSVSGKIAYPFVGPYAASKHALEAVSNIFRRELKVYGIDVIIIAPGSVETPIWEKEPVADMFKKYADTAWGAIIKNLATKIKSRQKNYLKAEYIAQKIWNICNKKRPAARYSIVKNYIRNWLLPHIIPPRLLDYFIIREISKEKHESV